MPNTLAHIGIQALLTRSVIRRVDPKWIYLGAIIPDVPWILQRAVHFILPGIQSVPLRLYFDVQASLLGSLLLCAIVALFARQRLLVFVLLGLNAGLHLVLDAIQTKWGNGVHFLAPFSWEQTNWGLFWPESVITYVLTLLGLGYILWHWRISVRRKTGVSPLEGRQIASAAVLCSAYLTIPLLFTGGAHGRESHTSGSPPPGVPSAQYVEFDRASVTPSPDGDILMCCRPDGVRAYGLHLTQPRKVSIRGYFLSEDELQVIVGHVHQPWFRDAASIVGLLLVVLLWVHSTVPVRPVAMKGRPLQVRPTIGDRP